MNKLSIWCLGLGIVILIINFLFPTGALTSMMGGLLGIFFITFWLILNIKKDEKNDK